MQVLKTITNYKRLTFTKLKYSKFDLKNPHKYAVIIEDARTDKVGLAELYINSLVRKFKLTPTIEREKFIEYQESIQPNPEIWLSEVYGALVDYTDEIRFMTMDDTVGTFKLLIREHLTSRTNPQLKWVKEKTELIELITALTADNAIKTTTGKNTQEDIIKAFEKFFGMELSNHRRLTKTALERVNKTPFLNELIKAFEVRAEEKNK